MKRTIGSLFRACALAAAFMLPAAAHAAPWQWAVTTTDVNLRAGPAIDYPAVTTVYAGAHIQLFGCLRDWSWCDIAWEGIRGWMAGDYIEVVYGQAYRYVPDIGVAVGVPFIGFDMDDYWGDHYRDRPWYRHWHRPDHDGDWRRPDHDGSGPMMPPPGGQYPEPYHHRNGHDQRHDDRGDWHPDHMPRQMFQQRNGVPMQGGSYAPQGMPGGRDNDWRHHPCPAGTVCQQRP